MFVLCASVLPPVLPTSKEMEIISCVTAGARQVVRAVAEMLLSSGFPAGRRDRTCSPCEWGELWGPAEHRTLRLLLWSLLSSLGCHKHAEHALCEDSSVMSLMCCLGTSPCGSDHGRNVLCHHLAFLFPKRVLSGTSWGAGCFPGLCQRLSGARSLLLLLQHLGLLHGLSHNFRKPKSLHLQISI